ncbi:MAG: FtsQ-type POTRA domain-containing protein [Clostridiales bacterium]|nr:FtsQ-type POTRA domain-containing protein [Clostridiales bacterium]
MKKPKNPKTPKTKKPLDPDIIDIFAEDRDDFAPPPKPARSFVWDTENPLAENEDDFAPPAKADKPEEAEPSGKKGKSDFADEGTPPLSDYKDVPALLDKEEEDEPEEEPFTFDEQGRRVPLSTLRPRERKREQRYGRRANAPVAGTKLWARETEEARLRREAAERAKARAAGREREYEAELRREKALRRVDARRRRSAILLFILGLGLLAAVFWFAFQVRSIDVIGDSARYTAAEIIEKSGLETGTHILMVDLGEAKKKLEEDPYLIPELEYIFPARIQITVRERVPVAAVVWGQQSEFIAIIDSSGIVLEPEEQSNLGLLEVLGITVTGAELGKSIGDAIDEQVFALVAVIQKLHEYDLFVYFKSLDVSEPMHMRLMTPQGYFVELGDMRDLDLKFSRMRKHAAGIMQQAALYKSEGKTVTIYLYSKNGVVVSPYPPDHSIPQETLPPDGTVPDSPAPGTTPATGEPPGPQTTPGIGGGDDPFTG